MKKNTLPNILLSLAIVFAQASCSKESEEREDEPLQPEKVLSLTYADMVDQLNKVFACNLYLAAEDNPDLQKEYLEKYFGNMAPIIDRQKGTITTNHYSTGIVIYTGNNPLTAANAEWTVKLAEGTLAYTLHRTGDNLYTLKGRIATLIPSVYTSLETDMDLRIKVETKDDIPYYPSYQKQPLPRTTWVYTFNGNSSTTASGSRLGYVAWDCEAADLKAYDPKMHFGTEPVYPAGSYFHGGVARMKLLRSLNGEAESTTLSFS
ncbi:hypothetical protein [Prevotella sp. KH2C16]|uniref:hypothetical protein n=1 Tax=Prevotella sp. KH2C16 TaxID=1855325 RepID=UPI0008E6ED5D|nr:hypothetical protein [Prevotella sp. KH2C16]SFG44082.1 hypothetical protein SAMN05216383_11438 [Prevotella sp. KH2C16]